MQSFMEEVYDVYKNRCSEHNRTRRLYLGTNIIEDHDRKHEHHFIACEERNLIELIKTKTFHGVEYDKQVVKAPIRSVYEFKIANSSTPNDSRIYGEETLYELYEKPKRYRLWEKYKLKGMSPEDAAIRVEFEQHLETCQSKKRLKDIINRCSWHHNYWNVKYAECLNGKLIVRSVDLEWDNSLGSKMVAGSENSTVPIQDWEDFKSHYGPMHTKDLIDSFSHVEFI